ncbi:MAG TPA: ABC transporter ATP-binding protein [Flavipsychrobacter sp.]|nr:ABC transporter ATP-binding protein [Flavipsychrobacter sp.]
MQTVLSIQNVSKSYGAIQALKNVSFEVPAGSVFGILGPNGSGKTTLLGILLDVLKADGGSFSWFSGISSDEARKQIGSLLETPNFYHYLSAMDNLEITSGIKKRGKDDRENILRKVGLYERKDSKFQTYSLGMKQRLAIGNALLGGPKLLVLDEPTNGLDPAGIAEIRELIKELNRSGITIIMASHLLDEVEKVCTHVAILKRGDLLVNGAVGDVLSNEDRVELKAEDMNRLRQLVSGMAGVQKVQLSDGFVYAHGHELDLADINRQCMEQGITLSHLAMKKKSLETKFIELTE